VQNRHTKKVAIPGNIKKADSIIRPYSGQEQVLSFAALEAGPYILHVPVTTIQHKSWESGGRSSHYPGILITMTAMTVLVRTDNVVQNYN
jgi:hypothetical protein